MLDAVIARFGLGRLHGRATPVSGGLSNQLWRATTNTGTFAVKRMVANADSPDFVDNVEASFAVEQRAYLCGVPMPKPIPDPMTQAALARIGGSLFRVHEWLDQASGTVSTDRALTLLGRIHAAGAPRIVELASTGWKADRWGEELSRLAEFVADDVPEQSLIVDSHRDLDQKNVLLTRSGAAALDWDAAGPTRAVTDVVTVALDWAGVRPDAFRAAIDSYRATMDLDLPAEPWVFGGWVTSQGEWLDYNADHRSGTAQGRHEIKSTLDKLRTLAGSVHTLVEALH